MKIKLNNVRLAFPELFEPTQVSGQGAFMVRKLNVNYFFFSDLNC